jgi:hypothetical protein
VQLGLYGLVTSGQVEGDPAVDSVARVDVLQPRAGLAAYASEVDVG